MSVLRRSALLLTIAVTTLVGLTANPAQAAFTAKTLPATVTLLPARGSSFSFWLTAGVASEMGR